MSGVCQRSTRIGKPKSAYEFGIAQRQQHEENKYTDMRARQRQIKAGNEKKD
jgi:hypothetical protein